MSDDSALPQTGAILDEFLKVRPMIFSICVGYTKNFQAAEELAQEVFCRAHERRAGFRDAEHLRRWMFAAARNLCFDHVRTARRRRVLIGRDVPPEGGGSDPQERVLNDERLRALKEAIGRLPERYRSVLILFEYGDLSYREIASVLKVRTGTVMSRLSRARRAAARLAESFLEGTHEKDA